MEENEVRKRVMTLQRLMFSVAVKTGLPSDDAADVVQETQLRLWRGRQGLPSDSAQLKAYCLTALRNCCISWLRNKRDCLSLEDLPENKYMATPTDVEDKDTRRYIEKAIDSLPPAQREVLKLSSLAGFDNIEIVEATGIKPDNVRQLISRGRRRLKEIFLNDNSSINER